MARSDPLRPKRIGAFEQHAELDRRIAKQAWIQRFAAQIALRKRRADARFQRAARVDHLERQAQAFGGAPRVRFRSGDAHVEKNAAHIIAAAHKQKSRHSGINAARKAENHFLHGKTP